MLVENQGIISTPNPRQVQSGETIRIWHAYLLVFISSSSGLIIEMVASRIMSPHVGTSIYSWTSIIGIALAGISVGNWLGGRLADKYASFKLLRRLYFLGGFTSLLIIPLTLPVMGNEVINNLPIQLRVLVSSTLLFFIPCTLFGTISPVVIKLALRDLETAGGKIGSIYAISTVGSIAGTFATGFFLIAFFGTTMIVWMVSALMIATGIVFCGFLGNTIKWQRDKLVEIALVLVAFAAISIPMIFNGILNGYCLEESDYYCIRIVDGTTQDGRPAKMLVLDHLVHNFIVPDETSKGGYSYEQIYEDVARVMNAKGEKIELLVIGAGAFSFPRYIRANYPSSTVDALEIDPAVVETTHNYLGLPRNTDISIFTEDARIYMNRNDIAGKYNLIQADAFMDVSVPYHLTTYEFNQKLKASLKPDGIYLANLIDIGQKGQFLRSYLLTIRKSFKNVMVYGLEDDLYSPIRSTFVVVATDREMSFPASNDWAFYGKEQLDAFIAKGNPVFLTDNYAPVDILLMPVVEDAMNKNKN
jgi:spermidine synthase